MALPFINDRARKRGQIPVMDPGEESLAAARFKPMGAHLTQLTI
jgi:hypothetical protein